MATVHGQGAIPPQPAAPPGPIRHEAHYFAPSVGAPPVTHYGPPLVAPVPLQASGSMMGGVPPPAFAPPPAYNVAAHPPAPPFGGAPGPALPAYGGPFPRTGFTGPGFDFSRLHAPAPAPPGPPPSTFPSSFVPVQPHKRLLIDDFLTVNALNALKSAPNKLMIDNSNGSISFQPDMSGVSAKKIKCHDLPAYLKSSERIKIALLQIGAIQGPDYDRYQDSCMTLLLDPKCGGNGWPFETFIEFMQHVR